MSKLYVIFTKEYVGNDRLMWRANSKGYTSNFEEAGRYTETEALGIVNSTHGTFAIDASEVGQHTVRVVQNTAKIAEKHIIRKDTTPEHL